MGRQIGARSPVFAGSHGIRRYQLAEGHRLAGISGSCWYPKTGTAGIGAGGPASAIDVPEKKQLEQRKVQIEEHVAREKKRAPPKIKPPKAAPAPGAKVEREKQKPLFDLPVSGEVPALDLLDAQAEEGQRGYSADELESLSRLLELKLKDFGVVAEVVAVYPWPCCHAFRNSAGGRRQSIQNI